MTERHAPLHGPGERPDSVPTDQTAAPRPRPGLSKLAVAAVTALMLFFSVFAVFSAIGFLQAPQPIAKVIGAAVLVIVAVGLWTLWRELRFGLISERMARVLDAEDGLPVDDLPRSPGGRIDRQAADAQFEAYRSEAEARPESWRAWYRLGLAYDASGDRRRGRAAVHRASRLFTAQRRA